MQSLSGYGQTFTHTLCPPVVVLFSPVVRQTNNCGSYFCPPSDQGLAFLLLSLTQISILDGAALFYVSSKEEKNVAVLHKYLVHRAYGMPFKEAAWVVDKDAVFM